MARLIAALVLLLVTTPAHAQGWRYLALGDSITAGRADGAVRSYVELLRDEATPFDTIINAGRSGYTTADVLRYWSGLVDSRPAPHVVSIMLGRNDTARVPLPEYLANMTEIVARLRARPHGDAFNGGSPDIVLLSPPYAGADGSLFLLGKVKQARHELYVEALRGLAITLGVRFLNVYELTGRWVGWDDRVWASPEWTYNGDRGHPTTATHAMLLPYIREAITAGVR